MTLALLHLAHLLRSGFPTQGGDTGALSFGEALEAHFLCDRLFLWFGWHDYAGLGIRESTV